MMVADKGAMRGNSPGSFIRKALEILNRTLLIGAHQDLTDPVFESQRTSITVRIKT